MHFQELRLGRFADRIVEQQRAYFGAAVGVAAALRAQLHQGAIEQNRDGRALAFAPAAHLSHGVARLSPLRFGLEDARVHAAFGDERQHGLEDEPDAVGHVASRK